MITILDPASILLCDSFASNNTHYIYRHYVLGASSTSSSGDLLIEGSNHGSDNDVDHVVIEGAICKHDYFSSYRGETWYMCLGSHFDDSDDATGWWYQYDINGYFSCAVSDTAVYREPYGSITVYEPITRVPVQRTVFWSPRLERRTRSNGAHVTTIVMDIRYDNWRPALQKWELGPDIIGGYTPYSFAYPINFNDGNYYGVAMTTTNYGEHSVDTGIVERATLNHLLGCDGALRARAFQKAAEGFSHLEMNNLESMRQLASLVNSILHKSKWIEVPKNFSALWLWYRYQYCTTKSDMKELSSKLEDVLNLDKNLKNTTRYGAVSSSGVLCRCRLTARPNVSSSLDSVRYLLQTSGLSPTLSNLWDMVPYSFVVDWFTSLGNLAKAIDTHLEFNETRYGLHSLCYSISDTGHDALTGLTYHSYKRWNEESFPPLLGWSTSNASQSTETKRLVDATALIVQKAR